MTIPPTASPARERETVVSDKRALTTGRRHEVAGALVILPGGQISIEPGAMLVVVNESGEDDSGD